MIGNGLRQLFRELYHRVRHVFGIHHPLLAWRREHDEDRAADYVLQRVVCHICGEILFDAEANGQEEPEVPK